MDIGEGGVHHYRVSYHLSRLAARHLDFELPAPVGNISLTAVLDGKRVEHEPIAEERPELRVRLARLRLTPNLVRRPAILELTYQLTPDRTDSTPVSSTLQAPRLLGEVGGVSNALADHCAGWLGSDRPGVGSRDEPNLGMARPVAGAAIERDGSRPGGAGSPAASRPSRRSRRRPVRRHRSSCGATVHRPSG